MIDLILSLITVGHWLMLVGILLVAIGFVGLKFTVSKQHELPKPAKAPR